MQPMIQKKIRHNGKTMKEHETKRKKKGQETDTFREKITLLGVEKDRKKGLSEEKKRGENSKKAALV